LSLWGRAVHVYTAIAHRFKNASLGGRAPLRVRQICCKGGLLNAHRNRLWVGRNVNYVTRNHRSALDAEETHQVSNSDLSIINPTPFNILNALQAIRGLLSVDEVADLLDLSKFTVYRMAKKKQIPCLLIGGSRRFDPSTLVLWLIKKEPQLAVAARQFQRAA
jgi:excisionase family DNA binding protein